MRQMVKGSSASQTEARDKSCNKPHLGTKASKQAMRRTVTNIRTPCPLSGGPLEDARKVMKKFNQIFLAEKKSDNKMINGLM